MRRLLVILLIFLPLSAKITWTTAAAVTTITVNVLEIKDNIHKAKLAASAVKKTTVKVAKKVVGK